MRKAPMVASSWLSWMSMLMTWTEALSSGVRFSKSDNIGRNYEWMRFRVNDVPIVVARVGILPFKLLVTEDGLTANTGRILQILLPNRHIIVEEKLYIIMIGYIL